MPNENVQRLRDARADLQQYSDTLSDNGRTPFADDDSGYVARNQAVADAEKHVSWWRR